MKEYQIFVKASLKTSNLTMQFEKKNFSDFFSLKKNKRNDELTSSRHSVLQQGKNNISEVKILLKQLQ
jgi:hypothetical protein